MATPLLDLNNLNGDNGFVIRGTTTDDRLGTKVDLTGDINGDGIEDIVITSIDGGDASTSPYSYNYSDRRGETYVVFGSQNSSTSSFDLNSLDGSNGFKVSGVNEDDQLGSAISVGDINGDGIDDLALGAPYAGSITTSYDYEYSRGEGTAYIIFGKQNGFAANVDLNSLNGNNGFFLEGIDAQDNLGTSITSAGDINGDGIDDLAVSAAGAGQTITNDDGYSYSDRRGETFIVFGKNNFNSNVNLATLDGSDGLKIQGKDAYDRLGQSLSNAGDINGDGIDDLVIGTPEAGDVLNSTYADGDSDRRGEAYVIFGQQNSFNSTFDLNNLNGNNGFTVAGIGIEDNLGSAVTNAGDINGDGIDDLILGAQQASQTGEYTFEGGAYVVFGKNTGFDPQFYLTTLDGTNGFSIPGLELNDNLGNAVTVGDINGDGIDDLIIGANTAGETIAGSDGYEYSDRRGKAYIVYGKNSNFDAAIDLNTISFIEGGEITGIGKDDIFGSAISSGGDVNGDGMDDLIISAPDDNVQGEYTREGEVYVVLMENEINQIVGDSENNSINGTNDNDEILGLAGDDTIDGKAGGDIINGGADRDSLLGGLGNDFISGNGGNDTLKGNQNNDTLDGNGGNDLLLGGIEEDLLFGGNNRDFLRGGDGNDSLNGGNGIDNLRGGDGNDSLNGDADNDRLFGDLGNDFLNGGDHNDILISEDGDDTLLGGSGADRLISKLGNDSLDGGDDKDILVSENGDDTLLGGSGADRLVSKLGNDSLDGGDDNDILVSEDGDDTLLGGSGADRLVSKLGNDSLDGGDDNDTLIGGDNNNLLLGGLGNDRLVGKAGKDSLDGGDNDDTLIGGNGNDVLMAGDRDDVVFGQSDNDTLAGENGNDSLFGGSGNDLVSGGDNLDVLDGDNGQDTLLGGIGQDTLFGGNGDDSLDGENNADRIRGEAGEDFLLGGFGNDTLYGGIGNDSLNGEGDNDVLDGVEMNNPTFGINELDTLTGGSGSDIFTLGDGNEVYYDDGISNTKGTNDFARLDDLDVNQDIIKMMGRINEYELNIYPNGSGGFNAEVLYNPGTYTLGELIGVLEDVPNDLELTDSVFAII